MSWARDEWPSERARLMSAHMQPIERLAAEATVEIVELESWWDDELKCEFSHGHTQCSGQVTHRGRNCVEARMVCHSAVAIIADSLKLQDSVCRDCGRPPAACWRLVPI